MAPALKRKTISEDGDPKRPPTTMSIKAPRTTASIIPTSLSQPVDAPVITLDSGELFVFGNNEAGQLGLEDPGQVKRYPFHMTADRVGSHPVHTVVCGGMHSVIVNTMGQAHTWGCNDEGALGTGPDDEDNWRPKLVKLQQKVVAVTAGDSHTAFMTDKGQIYLTGTMRDANGAFGLNPRSIEIQKEPFLYMDNKSRDENVVKDTPLKISSGYNHFGFLNRKHEVYLMGDSSNSQLGRIPAYRRDGGRDGRGYFLQRRKVTIQDDKRRTHFLHFSDLWCTPYGTFVRVLDQDRWFACGNNLKNQLGFPKEEAGNGIQEEWTEVPGLHNLKITKIVGTPTYTVALTKDGQLYVFGYKEYLGLSASLDESCTTEPILHPISTTNPFVDVGCASNNATVAVALNGDLYVWGSPSSSVVGTEEDDMEAVPEPTMVDSKHTRLYRMTSVSVGGSHAMLLGKLRETVNVTLP